MHLHQSRFGAGGSTCWQRSETLVRGRIETKELGFERSGRVLFWWKEICLRDQSRRRREGGDAGGGSRERLGLGRKVEVENR